MATTDRGFASMDKERQREIASRGGKAAHESGKAHEFSSDEARIAGRKGGQAVSRNKDHMAAIGSLGGKARSQNRTSTEQNSGTTEKDMRDRDEENDLVDVE